jgi:hypothetical protein
MPTNVRHKVEIVIPTILQGKHIVVCTLLGGRRLQHSRAFKTEEAAHDLAARVAVKGTIDLAHWVEMAPKGGSPAAAHLQAKAGAELARLEAAC